MRGHGGDGEGSPSPGGGGFTQAAELMQSFGVSAPGGGGAAGGAGGGAGGGPQQHGSPSGGALDPPASRVHAAGGGGTALFGLGGGLASPGAGGRFPEQQQAQAPSGRASAQQGAPGASNTTAPAGEKQLCTFFLRTGTCAYGDRCKFKHPLDRPPPQLNSRGYPLRTDEPDCAHYLKKGWCAFGPTCKFNHPELTPAILNAPAYTVSQPAAAFVSSGYPSAAPTVFSVPPPSAMPTLYYLPANQQLQGGGGMAGLQLSAAGAQQLFQAQQQALSGVGGGQPQLMYASRPQPGGVVGGGGLGYGGVSSMAALQEAMQGLNLARQQQQQQQQQHGGNMHLGRGNK